MLKALWLSSVRDDSMFFLIPVQKFPLFLAFCLLVSSILRRGAWVRVLAPVWLGECQTGSAGRDASRLGQPSHRWEGQGGNSPLPAPSLVPRLQNKSCLPPRTPPSSRLGDEWERREVHDG